MTDYRIEITVSDDSAGIALQIIDVDNDTIVHEANDLDSIDEAIDIARAWRERIQ